MLMTISMFHLNAFVCPNHHFVSAPPYLLHLHLSLLGVRTHTPLLCIAFFYTLSAFSPSLLCIVLSLNPRLAITGQLLYFSFLIQKRKVIARIIFVICLLALFPITGRFSNNFLENLKHFSQILLPFPLQKQKETSVFLKSHSYIALSFSSGSMAKRSRNGSGKNGTDEELPSQSRPKEHPRTCRKRKSKIIAAAPDSAVQLRRSARLRGLSNRKNGKSDGKLNSVDFDCYLENIWRELPEDKKSSFAYFESMWFYLYTTKQFKPQVLRRIKGLDIFSKKYVLVPIVLWDHWCLLIFCNLGGSLESESKTPCMLLLDSLHMAGPSRYEPEIRKFVLDIFKNEERPVSQQLIKKIKLLIPKVPQQTNGTDCGKFALYYSSLFLESAPENFSISEGYPYFMKRDWFTPDQLESFWLELPTLTKDSSEDMKNTEVSGESASGSEDAVIYLGHCG